MESLRAPIVRASYVRGVMPELAGCAPATAPATSDLDGPAVASAVGPMWLLAGVALLRRADAVEVIGEAIVASAAGLGHRLIATRLDRPAATVRGWLRRFGARAEQTASHGVAWIYRVDVTAFRAEPGRHDTPVRFALAALGRAVAAAERFMGTTARPRWLMGILTPKPQNRHALVRPTTDVACASLSKRLDEPGPLWTATS